LQTARDSRWLGGKKDRKAGTQYETMASWVGVARKIEGAAKQDKKGKQERSRKTGKTRKKDSRRKTRVRSRLWLGR
jgi:uncharacterized membrane protein YebE (DUF533 family)